MNRKPIQERKKEYKLESNEHVRVRREEEMRYEKDIIDKCKDYLIVIQAA